MNEATIALLTRWRDMEIVGVLLCEAIARETGDRGRQRRWLTMARLERRMYEEIVAHLGSGDVPCLSADREGVAERLARDYLAHGPLGGAGQMARDVGELLHALRRDVAATGDSAPILDRLVRHEEAWLDFLLREAAGQVSCSEHAALRFLVT